MTTCYTKQCIKHKTNRDKSIAGSKSTIVMCRATFDYLCNEYSVVSLDVLVAYAASNTEPEPYATASDNIFKHVLSCYSGLY